MTAVPETKGGIHITRFGLDDDLDMPVSLFSLCVAVLQSGAQQ